MSRPPVVFVPGFGGSFNLPILLDLRGPTLSGWGFPPFVDYGTGFLNAFQQQGYRRDEDLIVAFYDWRKAVYDSARDYLIPWIDRALAHSGRRKVTLVAHSMGGVVARAYVQTDLYRGDVDRLITLGSPFYGTPPAYYAWAGGEIVWGPVADAVLRVYLFYMGLRHPFGGLDPFRVLRREGPGLRDLLPVYDYLEEVGPPRRLRPVGQMTDQNEQLKLLNAPRALDTLFSRVRVTAITSTGLSTSQGLVVGPAPQPPGRPPRFPDGAPLEGAAGRVITEEGDSTIPLRSAFLDDPRAEHIPLRHVVHAWMPDRPTVIDRLFDLLGLPTGERAAPPPQHRHLVIMTGSPMDVAITPPSTERALEAAMPSVQTLEAGHARERFTLHVITDPEPGAYDVRLRGLGTGAYSLGAMMVEAAGAEETASDERSLEAATAPADAVSEVATEDGLIATKSELYYQVIVPDSAATPTIRFDAGTTYQRTLTRLRDATQDRPEQMRGLEAEGDTGERALEAAPGEEDTRAMVLEALTGEGLERAGPLPDDDATMGVLDEVTTQVVAPDDPALALALAEQLARVRAARGA